MASDDIIDPHFGIKSSRVNTEYLLLKLADIASQAGIQGATPYYRAVIKQIEILGSASNLLTPDYYKQFKKMENEMHKKVNELNQGINPRIKKSRFNAERKNKIEIIQREFVENWHQLLFKYLRTKFYQIRVVDRI